MSHVKPTICNGLHMLMEQSLPASRSLLAVALLTVCSAAAFDKPGGHVRKPRETPPQSSTVVEVPVTAAIEVAPDVMAEVVDLTSVGRESASPSATDSRRLLLAQIVEDEAGMYSESAILEGAPYKYFLRLLAGQSHDDIRKQTNPQITFDNLMDKPGLYRGQVVTLAQGIVLEVSQAIPPREYGLPEGCTVLPAIFVDSARDVYALRIVSPPGSKLYQRLKTGIETDQFPVLRISGYFMKLYARKTNDTREPPWRRPLLLCPEPEFSQAAKPRPVAEELRDSNNARLLPSQRLDAPGAEERMVVEVVQAGEQVLLRSEGRELEVAASSADLHRFFVEAGGRFSRRLPDEQKKDPAAVVLKSGYAARASVDALITALRSAGFKRIAVKTEQ